MQERLAFLGSRPAQRIENRARIQLERRIEHFAKFLRKRKPSLRPQLAQAVANLGSLVVDGEADLRRVGARGPARVKIDAVVDVRQNLRRDALSLRERASTRASARQLIQEQRKARRNGSPSYAPKCPALPQRSQNESNHEVLTCKLPGKQRFMSRPSVHTKKTHVSQHA